MNLKIFEEFLNTCYFKTYQIKAIVKANLKEKSKIIREIKNSCIWDTNFYIKHNYQDIQGHLIDQKDLKPNGNAIIPVIQDSSSNEEVMKIGDKKENETAEEKQKFERVIIKAIEFDWIFNTKEGDEFLGNLTETENLELSEIDIIRDIILFLWSYFKIQIVIKLFIPYFVYIWLSIWSMLLA